MSGNAVSPGVSKLKEELRIVKIDEVPADYSGFMRLFEELSGTPEGAAAMFALTLLITAKDRELGRKCVETLTLTPPEAREFEAEFPEGTKLEVIARSYFRELPDGALEAAVKLTGEKPLKRHYRTVYIGCRGTAGYRPVTLVSKPPRYFKKRYGIRRDYYNDPWLTAEYPSMLLPVLYEN